MEQTLLGTSGLRKIFVRSLGDKRSHPFDDCHGRRLVLAWSSWQYPLTGGAWQAGAGCLCHDAYVSGPSLFAAPYAVGMTREPRLGHAARVQQAPQRSFPEYMLLETNVWDGSS